MTSGDARVTLRRTYPARCVAEFLLTHPAGDYGGAIARATGLSPRIVMGAKGVLRRLVAAAYATLEVEQVDPAELKRPRRTYYRLTEAGRLWAAARVVVWRRTINLQEAEAPVTVSIVHLPVGGGDTETQEAWRVELSGGLSQLTAGDASSLALLLGRPPRRWSPPSSRQHLAVTTDGCGGCEARNRRISARWPTRLPGRSRRLGRWPVGERAASPAPQMNLEELPS